MKTAKRLCPICNESQVHWLHTQRFELPAGHPLAGGYDVVQCAACDFVYADSAVSQTDYDRFYTQYSKEDGKTGTGRDESLTIANVASRVTEQFLPPMVVEICGQADPLKRPERYVPDVRRAKEELGLQVKINLDNIISQTLRFQRRDKYASN